MFIEKINHAFSKHKNKEDLTALATNDQQKSDHGSMQKNTAAAQSDEADYSGRVRSILEEHPTYNKYYFSKEQKKEDLTVPATNAQQKSASKSVQPKPAAPNSAEPDYIAEARRIIDSDPIFNKYRNR